MAGTRDCTLNIILKIYCKSFFIYFAIDRAIKIALKVRIRCFNNSRGSKSLLNSLSRRIDHEKLELYTANVELGSELF